MNTPPRSTLSALLSLAIVGTVLAQPCPEGEYVLTTQSDVNAFPEGCSRLLDSLRIGPSADITDLLPLSRLSEIEGSLIIAENELLATLHGLEAISAVPLRESVRIYSNASLKNLDGLSGLEFVGWDLLIADNDSLENLDGLSSLTNVAGSLEVVRNPSLHSCSCGLYSLVTGGDAGWIWIADNAESGDCNDGGADLVGDQCPSVGITQETIPIQFTLSQNYPNPFNPTTTVTYEIPQAADVTLTVADVLGRKIRELASGTRPAGTYEVSFDATGLPSGVYFYRLQAGDYVETKRMVVVR